MTLPSFAEFLLNPLAFALIVPTIKLLATRLLIINLPSNARFKIYFSIDIKVYTTKEVCQFDDMHVNDW